MPETKDEVFRIDIDLPNEATVEDALPDILSKFNEKFKEEQLNILFDPSRLSSFELLLASKSGKAKSLMPSKKKKKKKGQKLKKIKNKNRHRKKSNSFNDRHEQFRPGGPR